MFSVRVVLPVMTDPTRQLTDRAASMLRGWPVLLAGALAGLVVASAAVLRSILARADDPRLVTVDDGEGAADQLVRALHQPGGGATLSPVNQVLHLLDGVPSMTRLRQTPHHDSMSWRILSGRPRSVASP